MDEIDLKLEICKKNYQCIVKLSQPVRAYYTMFSLLNQWLFEQSV